MTLNRSLRDQHAEPGILRQLIERDVCLLYHQLSEYSGIMGDLDYARIFALPYWEHLSHPIEEPEAGSFARDGCLVMILAMACESIDGSGAYILHRLDACLAAIARVDAADADTARLVATVRLALQLVQSAAAETELFHAECDWVHRRYVHGYFTERASSRSEQP